MADCVSTAYYKEKINSLVKGASYVRCIVRWSTWLPSGWPQLLPGELYLREGRPWEPFWPEFKFLRTNKLISCSKAQSERLQCVYWLLHVPALENKQTAQPDSFLPPTVLSSIAWVCQEKSLRPYGNKRAKWLRVFGHIFLFLLLIEH